jgi:glucose-1-phosphate thymidylyltransferase
MLKSAAGLKNGARIFGYKVKDPKQFGVIDFDDKMSVLSIEEKPDRPKSNYAVTGLYFYDNNVISMAKSIKPSKRGELEITNLNNMYLQRKDISVEVLGRGFAWLDTGTHDSLLEAGSFVQTLEHRQGIKIACLEEIALNNDWLTYEDIRQKGEDMSKTSYGQYILSLGN